MWSNAARAAPESEEAIVLLNFAGHNFEPLLSGALYWHAESTLLVADLHFEKFSSFARRGQMLPPYDTGLTLKRLEPTSSSTRAERVVSLGDSFHRDEGTTTLLDADRLRLDGADRQIALDLDQRQPRSVAACAGRGVRAAARTSRADADARAAGAARSGLIAGHLHPAARVMVRRPLARAAPASSTTAG